MTLLRRFVAIALALGSGAAACSSVPDIRFVDDAAADGGRDAASDTSSGYSCPGAPPAPADGVCCGSRLCLNCSLADCFQCMDADCTGTDDSICCRRGGGAGGAGGGQVQCRAADDCR